MQDMWQKIVDSWQIKTMCSGAVTCLTFLLGDVTAAPFIALWLLVTLDTFTRWAAIGRKTLVDNKMTGSIWFGIYCAVIDRRINSETMRGQFQTKAIGYLVLLAGFNLVDTIIPDVMFGQSFVGLPNSFISTWLALVEIQSITENLIECGMPGLSPLTKWAAKRQEQMTDTNQPYQYGGYSGPRPVVPVVRPTVRPNFAPDPNDKEGNK